MKLRRSLSEPEEPIELNLIPLIDVIMFLLIFFISTTSFMDQPGISVDKPQSGSQGENKSIIFAVTGDGRITHNGKEISLDGVGATVKRLCAEERLPVIIEVSQKARSGMVIRVIDKARLGGAKDVSLASDKT
jgi:biopolymer transport protein ExbD